MNEQVRSEHSERLRELAVRYAPRLLAAGARAVAATGSAGRGDADAGSDLDLWVISEQEGVDHDIVEGVPITVIRECEARALDVAHLAGVEVELTHVISDPDAVFARVFARFAENANEIRACNLEGALGRLRALLAAAHDGSPHGRLWMHRNAAHLATALRTYLETGFMMPKMRHFRVLLPTDAFDLLRAILGIDEVAAHAAELVDASASIAQRLNAQLDELGLPYRQIATPHGALRKLEHGDLDDGIVLLRRFFDRCFVDQILAAVPDISMVRFLLEVCDADIRRYWRALYGLDCSDAELDQKACAAQVAVRGLLERIAIPSGDDLEGTTRLELDRVTAGFGLNPSIPPPPAPQRTDQPNVDWRWLLPPWLKR